VLPVLLLLVFGIIDFGRMLNAKITLTEAAREAARSAALQTAAAGIARAAAITDPAIGTTTPTVTDCTNDAATQAEATLTYQFTFVTPIGFMAGFLNGSNSTVPLTAKSVMQCMH
jgi:Flp pilus assembly protein TadG